jgi:hypothetical protein
MRQTRFSASIGWIVLFVAVIGHLPALKGFFAQDDWSFLARGMGEVEWTGLPARPLSAWFYWRLLVPILGVSSPPYHGLSLLSAGLFALLSARVGAQLGLRTVGTAVAGLVVAASGAYALAIFWVSATGELLAALFCLGALSLWLDGGRWRFGAALLAILSFASKEAGWALPLWLLIFGARLCPRAQSRSRGVRIQLGAFVILAGLSLWNTARHIPHAPGSPYELGSGGEIARNALGLAGWLVSPLRYAPLHSELNLVLGGAVVVLWGGFAWSWWRHSTGPARWVPLAGLVWSSLALVPIVGLRTHMYPYYLTLALPGLAWALGALSDRLDVGGRETATPSSRDRRAAALVVSAVVLCAVAWSTSQRLLFSRDGSGMHVDPIVRRSFMAAEAARLLAALPLSGSGELAILQATRVQLPDDIVLPEGELLAGTPLLGALDGLRGLRMLVPEGVRVRWSAHLDGVRPTAQILLDAGGPTFRVLGLPEQARMYSALIAISAGQHERGRHDLWNVVTRSPDSIRFVYDADNLPIQLEDLRRESRAFVQLLGARETSRGDAILNLFAQLYEAIFGEPLSRTPWGGTLRADETKG